MVGARRPSGAAVREAVRDLLDRKAQEAQYRRVLEQDVQAILQGDSSRVPDLIRQLNSNGTETVQSYRIEQLRGDDVSRERHPLPVYNRIGVVELNWLGALEKL